MSMETILAAAISAAVIAIAVAVFVAIRTRARSSGSIEPSWSEQETAALQAGVAELNTKLAYVQESVTRRDTALDQRMQGLGDEMRQISGLFTNDRARGAWGEISMLRVFELGGLVEGHDYTAHFNAGDRKPDAVVHLPGERKIVIDSKFPVARYNEALDADDPAEVKRLLVEQGKELERVGKSLIDKGYGKLASGGYVVMYLPSQPVYEASVDAYPDVIERLMGKGVVIAGPTTLFALLMHAGTLVSEHRAIQQSDEILDAAKQLHGRMTTFLGHLQKLGRSLTKTVESFNGAVGSWTARVSPQLNRMSEIGGHETPEPLDPIDEAVRRVDVEEPTRVTSSLN